MSDGLSGIVVGVCVGIFAGAVACEVLSKTGVCQAAARKISNGVESAKKSFIEGYQTAAEQSQPDATPSEAPGTTE